MTQLRCTGGEHRLLDCPYDHTANIYYDDWGVSCRNGNNIIIIFLSKFSKTLHYYTLLIMCVCYTALVHHML